MSLHSHLSNEKKITHEHRVSLKIFLFFCAILIISNTALAADQDVIIGFKKPVGPSEEALIHSNGGLLKKSFHLIPAISARIPENKIDTIKKDSRIAYIENDAIFKAADEYTNSWGVQHIGTQTVHNQNIYGDGVKIAVLDTGIDYMHPELVENYKGGIGFVEDTNGNVNPSNYDDSYNSHGTHVSGIIAAKNNGIGVVGVAPNSSIYAIKVLGGSGHGNTSWIISGIQWAVDNKMNIATMSLYCLPNPDFPGCDSIALRDASNNAYNSGLLLVAAAGNTNGGAVGYPAAYESVIAVTATDSNDKDASFSPIDPKIELAAPGVNINSTIRGDGYGILSGTSMAAPHVAGVAALVLSSNFADVNVDGKRDNQDVRLILRNTAKDLGSPGKDDIYGYGLVDASMAVLGYPAPSDIELTIARTNGKPDDDAKNVSLSHGNYSVTIANVNLNKLDMVVYENGVVRKDLSSKYHFDGSNEIRFDLQVSSEFEVVFVPYGNPSSVGHVTIKRLIE